MWGMIPIHKKYFLHVFTPSTLTDRMSGDAGCAYGTVLCADSGVY